MKRRVCQSARGAAGVVRIPAIVLGLASGALWFYRDVGSVAQDFGPDEGSRCVNVNAADAELLATLPGIGEALAQRIIVARATAECTLKPLVALPAWSPQARR